MSNADKVGPMGNGYPGKKKATTGKREPIMDITTLYEVTIEEKAEPIFGKDHPARTKYVAYVTVKGIPHTTLVQFGGGTIEEVEKAAKGWIDSRRFPEKDYVKRFTY